MGSEYSFLLIRDGFLLIAVLPDEVLSPCLALNASSIDLAGLADTAGSVASSSTARRLISQAMRQSLDDDGIRQ